MKNRKKKRTRNQNQKQNQKISKASQEKTFADVVEQAVDECISEGVLVDFLQKNREEVIRNIVYEYNEQRYIQQERDEAWEAGEKKGMDRVNELHARLIVDQRIDDLKQAVGDKAYQEKLMAEYGIE